MKYEINISKQRGWKFSFTYEYEGFLKFLEECEYKLYILGANDLEIKLHEKMLKTTVEAAINEYIECKVFGIENKAIGYIGADDPWDYAADKLREFSFDYPMWFVLEDHHNPEFACDFCGEPLGEEEYECPGYPLQTHRMYGHDFTLCDVCVKKYFEEEEPS